MSAYQFPVTGTPPAAECHFARQHEALRQLDLFLDEVREEVWFDAAEWQRTGTAVLLRDDNDHRVGSALMSSHHADARLVIGD